MECSHCKNTDQIVATEIRSLMRDATEYVLGCKACGFTWHQRKSWRGNKGQWGNVKYISDEEYDVLFPPKHTVFQRLQPDYDYYIKHGDIGKKFHVYHFGQPSHCIDPLDPDDKPEVARAFIMEWIADSDDLEYVTAILRPEDFVTVFKFRSKRSGELYQVPVPPKSHLIWHQGVKMFTTGTFEIRPMPSMNLSGLYSMSWDISKEKITNE